MKIIYCIADIYNPGGMERVLLNKLQWLAGRGGYELGLVTTDQNGRPPFYRFPDWVKMTDLAINYKADNGKNPLAKTLGYLRRRRLHRKALTEHLMRERADIVVSLYPSESSFIPRIKDGSRKVLELHFDKFFRLQYNRKGLLGLADRLRTWQDERIVRRFDKFVVLTQQDAQMWDPLPNLEVIPNAAPSLPDLPRTAGSKRVIAAGRLDYQKGFDRLLDAWAMLPDGIRREWHLDIFGQGEWKERLEAQAARLGISDSASINPPTDKIFAEYADSSVLVMSSHYEGFPMVMIEAMASGLPVVSFDFPCGPRDIITPGTDGLIVQDGDIASLAGAMLELMENPAKIEAMSIRARKVSETYSEDKIMGYWEKCFKDLLS